jgi:hypothetical protein
MRSIGCTPTLLSPSHSRRELTSSSHRSFPGLDGLYGYVTVEGEPLEVYGVNEEGGKTVAYIEAKQGKRFEIAWVDQRSRQQVQHPFSMDSFVDGIKYVRRTLLRPFWH